MIHIKRAYDPASPSDGTRVLVDRLWPRGISKEKLKLDMWLKDVGPSTSLRQWFSHDPERWDEFQHRYLDELKQNPDTWTPVLEAASEGNITLIFGSKDTAHNNAVALQKFLETKIRTRKSKK